MKKLLILSLILLSCEREAPIDSLTGDWTADGGILTLKQDGEQLSGNLEYFWDDIASYLVGTVRGDSVQFDIYITQMLNGYKYVDSYAGVLTYETSELYSQSMRGVVRRKDQTWDFVAYKIRE